jgi:phage terminase large subunit-like protein
MIDIANYSSTIGSGAGLFSAAFGRAVRQVVRSTLKPMIDLPEDTVTSLQRYCPHVPHPRQAAFLALNCKEAFYGGAAGGGKSDALLMAALQYVHIPGYSALILRRDFARLALAGAIMDRAKSWLIDRTDAKWNGTDKAFTFPSGAKLQFGYIDNPDDRFRYASAEYQFIGWDELTEFRLSADETDETNPYLFLFSRLRQTLDIGVPLRVRSASNPGNIGHAWVKKRFIPADFRGITDDSAEQFEVDGRFFVPAKIRDNKAVDEGEYSANLSHLPPVTRERLMAGDWSVAESLQIPEEWLLSFEAAGNLLRPFNCEGKLLEPVDDRECLRFATIDTAGTSRDKADEKQGKPPSWSACGIWDWDRKRKRLFLRHVFRDRVGWNELKLRIPEVLKSWNCKTAKIENAHVGQPLADELRAVGISTELVGPVLPGMADGWRGAKLERAIAGGLLTMLEKGQVFLPRSTGIDAKRDWLPHYRLELTSWTGGPEETCDQIDMSSYATWHCRSGANSWGGVI